MSRESQNKIESKIAITKQTFREQIWTYFVKNKICAFPNPFGRIPNFKGVHQAAAQLTNLKEFELAKSVEVNPDKPLLPSRAIILQNGKELYVTVPRLQEGLLKKLVIQEGMSIRKLVSRWGIDNVGLKIDLDSKIHIDLLVVGSVAVSKEGYRIGKGKGYADLEFAILKEMQAIDDSTIIVTVVHDSQVFDELPRDLFKKYDVPIDYILTPTRIIKVDNVLPRPAGIFWDLLSESHLKKIEILRTLKLKHEKGSKSFYENICLNEYYPSKSYRRNRRSKTKFESDANKVDRVKQKNHNNKSGNTHLTNNNENIPPWPSIKRKNKHQCDFTLLIENIERNVRCKDMKRALIEEGFKPDSITWRGYRGFCYLNYSTPNKKNDEDKREAFSIDNVIEVLQRLKITPHCKQNLTVKVVEPITRIETTDVSSV